MKTSAKSQTIKVPRVDILAPDAAEQFRRAAEAFQARINQSPDPKKAARDLLVREGILTRSGRLTKNYSR